LVFAGPAQAGPFADPCGFFNDATQNAYGTTATRLIAV
jgi:hypothetical protein